MSCKKIKYISEQASGVLYPRGASNETYYLYKCLVGPVTGGGGAGGRAPKRKFTHMNTVFTTKDITYTVLYI